MVWQRLVVVLLITVAALGGGACAVESASPVDTTSDLAAVGAIDAPIAALSPWTSRHDCEVVVGRGERAPRGAGPRFGTWNVRWFPTGTAPFDPAPGAETDLSWFACVLVWLDFDALALEEVLMTPDAVVAMATVLGRAEDLGGTSFAAVVSPCDDPEMQHQAFVYRPDRLTLTSSTLFAFDPGSPCSASMRPAFVARFAEATSGAEHVIAAVHLKSGSDSRSIALRDRALSRLPILAEQHFRHAASAMLVGDFNTMGCRQCSPRVYAENERAALDVHLAAAGLVRSHDDSTCSSLGDTRVSLLDFIAMRTPELPDAGPGGAPLTTRTEGICRERSCTAGPAPALDHLSDHCPVMTFAPTPAP